MKVVEAGEFDKDMRRLRSKYRSIDDDLSNFRKVLTKNGLRIIGAKPGEIHGAKRIDDLGERVVVPIYKMKKFRCKTMRGKGSKSGIRVIYAYEESHELYNLIEIYCKTMKNNEDTRRILKYYQT